MSAQQQKETEEKSNPNYLKEISFTNSKKVNLNDLVARLKEEKKKIQKIILFFQLQLFQLSLFLELF